MDSSGEGDANKIQRVEGVETYEPKKVALEIAQQIKDERDSYLQKERDSEEHLPVFSII